MLLPLLLLALHATGQWRNTSTPPTGIPMSGRVALRVTLGKTSRPAAGAEIRCRELDEFAWLDLRCTPGTRIDELLQGEPVAARTDGQGRARLPLSARSMLIEVRAGDLWWAESFTPDWLQGSEDEKQIEVELLEDYDLEVLAVDARHQPLAGVPVALRRYLKDDPSDAPPTLTDSAGRVRLRHAGFFVNQCDGWGDTRTMVAVSACLAQPVEQWIDPRTRPTKPIELILPPTGEVELAFEDADGKPIRADAGLGLTSERKEPYFDYWAVPGNSIALAPHRTSFTFPCVGLGLDLHAWAQRNGASLTLHAAARGPQSAGEHVRIVISTPAGQPGLAGRLADGAGKAVANRDFSVGTLCKPEVFQPGGGRCSRGHSSLSGIGIHTDADGGFRIDIDDSWDLDKAAEYQFDDYDRDLAARAPVTQPKFTGVCDLGTLEMREHPVRFRGRIVDDLGRAVAGAIVSLECMVGWCQDPGDALATRLDGSFEYRGDERWKSAELRFRLMAQREGYAGEALPIVFDPESVRTITLPRACRLRGRFAPAAGVSFAECSIDWGAEDPETRKLPGRHGWDRLAADGSFDLPCLHPGSYSLSVVRLDRSCERTIKGIVCRAGEDRDLGELK